MIITEEQKKEIESLISEHGEALINYGTDMYSSGVIKGMVIGVTGMTIGYFVFTGEKIIKKYMRKKKV